MNKLFFFWHWDADSEVNEKLSSKCKEEIFRVRKEASNDFIADAMLTELCTDDAQVRWLYVRIYSNTLCVL